MQNSHFQPANAGGRPRFRRSPSAGRNPFITFLLCVGVVVVGSVLMRAQPSSGQSDQGQGYPVTIEGHEVLRIYEPVGAFSAHDRAQKISERLQKLVFAPGADLSAITTSDSDYGTEIRLGDNVLLIVTDDDANRAHLSRGAVAKYCVGQVRNSILQVRHEHGAKFLIKAAIYAAAILLLYLGLVWLVVQGSRRLLQRLQRADAPLFKGIKIQRSEILAGERLAGVLTWIVRVLRAVLLFILSWFFLAIEFSFFPWTRVHGRQLLDYVVTPIRFVGTAVVDYLPKLFYIVVIVVVMHFVLKFVRLLTR